MNNVAGYLWARKNLYLRYCHKPNIHWLDFLQRQTRYDACLVVDDNKFNYTREYQERFPDIKIVQLNELECARAGFSYLNDMLKKRVSGWDKAVYYFSAVNRFYDHVWFIEDHVFSIMKKHYKKR